MATCNEYLVCPFDKVHRILKSRMQTHIVKCKKNFPCSTKKECPFNPLHWVEEVEYQYHINNCADSLTLTSQLYTLEPTQQQVGNVSLEDIKKLTENIQCSENWDDEPPALSTYDPYKNIENKNIVIPMIVESQSKKKQFRQSQRQRFANFPDQTLDTTSTTQTSFIDMCSEEPLRRPRSVASTALISHKKNTQKIQSANDSFSSSASSSSSTQSNVKPTGTNLEDDFSQLSINKKNKKGKRSPRLNRKQKQSSKSENTHGKASDKKIHESNNNAKHQKSDKISLNTTYDVHDCKTRYDPLIDESGHSDTTVLINNSYQSKSNDIDHETVTPSDIFNTFNNQMEVLLKAEASISEQKLKLTAQMAGALETAQLKNPFSDVIKNPRCAANFNGSNRNAGNKQPENKLEILKNRFGLSNTSLYDPNSSMSTANASQYLGDNESHQFSRHFKPNASFFSAYEEEGPSGVDLDNTDGFITKK